MLFPETKKCSSPHPHTLLQALGGAPASPSCTQAKPTATAYSRKPSALTRRE